MSGMLFHLDAALFEISALVQPSPPWQQAGGNLVKESTYVSTITIAAAPTCYIQKSLPKKSGS